MLLVGVMSLSLSLLAWSLWLWSTYAAVSITAILMRVGVEKENPVALWIDRVTPTMIRAIGMFLSSGWKLSAAIGLVALGWLGRDSWEFHNTFVLTNVIAIAQAGDIIYFHGKPEVVPENTWWFQRTTPPVGQAFPFTVCSGKGEYVPEIRKGAFVEVAVYTVRKYPVDCFSVASKPLGIIYR